MKNQLTMNEKTNIRMGLTLRLNQLKKQFKKSNYSNEYWKNEIDTVEKLIIKLDMGIIE